MSGLGLIRSQADLGAQAQFEKYMLKDLFVLLSCFSLGFGQKAPQPCKPLTYFGVQGCAPSAEGKCPRGYQVKAVCPSNPMMKAPCRLMCVVKGKTAKKKPVAVEIPRCWRVSMTNGLGVETLGAKTKECNYQQSTNFGRLNSDAIITPPKAIFANICTTPGLRAWPPKA